MRGFYKCILKLFGWSIEANVDFPDKCVICVAPHTSNWDMPLGFAVYKSMGKSASFLIKKDWFFFPMNLFFKAIGGIPVDRSKSMSMTDQIVEVFNSREQFHLAITPEGTRKGNAQWKMGFYYIALAANVPIIIASFNYEDKIITFHDMIKPSGDVDKDLLYIKEFYKGAKAKHPEKFLL